MGRRGGLKKKRPFYFQSFDSSVFTRDTTEKGTQEVLGESGKVTKTFKLLRGKFPAFNSSFDTPHRSTQPARGKDSSIK